MIVNSRLYVHCVPWSNPCHRQIGRHSRYVKRDIFPGMLIMEPLNSIDLNLLSQDDCKFQIICSLRTMVKPVPQTDSQTQQICKKRYITRYVDSGAVKEVAREELSVECGAHEDDTQIRSLWQHVSQHHHQEVTTKHKLKRSSNIFKILKTYF